MGFFSICLPPHSITLFTRSLFLSYFRKKIMVSPPTTSDTIKRLHQNPDNTRMIVVGTSMEARSCLDDHGDLDGLMCHYFSGDVIDFWSASGKQTFLVARGSWSSSIIQNFESEFVKGPSLVVPGEMDEEEFRNGAYGVVFEMSNREAMIQLRKLSPGRPYHLVRFRFQP